MIKGAVVIMLLALTELYATPTWYNHLPSKTSNYYIGYGISSSEARAKRIALKDISEQISVKVNTELYQNTSVKNEMVNREFTSKSSVSSSARIHGYKILKSAFDDGRYYVAIGYENIPSIEKFNKKLNSISITTPEVLNAYLKQAPITNYVSKPVGFSLKRKDGLWYIRYRDIYQVLDKRDFESFFTSVSTPRVEIKTNNDNKPLYDGDEFYFNVTSKQKGFVTVLTVYEDGTVATLLRNVPIKKGETKKIPDEKFESILEAGLVEECKETFDLYVAIFSSKKLFFDQFAQADEELISNERYKNFDTLIKMMDNYDFATVKIVTKP